MLRRAVQDWEVAKAKQDKALDNIEKGIGMLKGIGEAMGESLKQQDIVLDTIDDKVHRVPVQVCLIVWLALLLLCRTFEHHLALGRAQGEV